MSVAYIWEHCVDGVVIGEIHRVMRTNGRKDDIPHYHKNGGGFDAGIPEDKKPLPPFGIDSFKHTSKPLLICEGQKAQTAWASLGYQCVTSVLGATNAKSTDWSKVKPARKIIFAPDNDRVGERYVREVCALITPEETPSIIRFPELPDKADIVDWLQLQPELIGWNGLDPLTEHPARDVIVPRLSQLINERAAEVPESWMMTWPEPEAIESRLDPVHAIALEMIPKPLQPWLKDAAYRMEVPIDYLAIGVISAVGSVIGTRCGVRPRAHDDWTMSPNLWACVIGPPGDGKTPALREAIFAVEMLEMDAAQKAAAGQREYEAKVAAYDAREKSIKDEMNKAAKNGAADNIMHALQEKLSLIEEPAKPDATRYIANDTTIEALISLLKDNQRGLLMFQDELATLLQTWEKQGHETDRSFFLQCWTGNGKHRQDRIGRGSIVAEKLCLSVLGGIQEDLLRGYLATISDGRNDGLIQRFQLMIYPDPRPVNMELIDSPPDKEARLRAYSIFRDISRMDFQDYGANLEDEKLFFRFDQRAQNLYYEWERDLKQKVANEELPMMREHLSKFRSLMPRLALIFHLVECAATTNHGDITAETARLAAAWCGYLEEHARRVYGLLKARDESAASVLAEKILEGKLPEKFSVRHVIQRRWRMLGKKEHVQPALAVLVEAGWLRQSMTKTDGHPRIEYLLNPRISNQHKVLKMLNVFKGTA